jgi:hypothetical protein
MRRYAAFYPIRTDRHIFQQVANTIAVCLLGQGGGWIQSNLNPVAP